MASLSPNQYKLPPPRDAGRYLAKIAGTLNTDPHHLILSPTHDEQQCTVLDNTAVLRGTHDGSRNRLCVFDDCRATAKRFHRSSRPNSACRGCRHVRGWRHPIEETLCEQLAATVEESNGPRLSARPQLDESKKPNNQPMQPSGEVGRFEMDDQPSPPADRCR